MTAGVLEEIVAGHLRGIPRMNVAEFERYMQERFPDGQARCELIDGYPVYRDSSATGGDPMIMGARHSLVVDGLNARLIILLAGSGWGLKCQTAIILNDLTALEPDLTIIRGRSADYASQLPGPAAIPMVIEVADSSVEADRITKLSRYATAAIPVYWIINIRDHQIEVYESPDPETGAYTQTRVFGSGESVEFQLPDFPVQRLLVDAILDGTI